MPLWSPQASAPRTQVSARCQGKHPLLSPLPSDGRALSAFPGATGGFRPTLGPQRGGMPPCSAGPRYSRRARAPWGQGARACEA
jgi:hypothetical protein